MASWPAKDPEDFLDYTIDWTLRLEGGETISTSTWSVESGTIVIEAFPAPSIAAGVTKFWASGGTLGETNVITNHIVTSAGRERDASGRLKIKAK